MSFQKSHHVVFGLRERAVLFFGILYFWFLCFPPASLFAGDDKGILFHIPAIISTVNPAPVLYGEVHGGLYHLGPVDFAETIWHNACAPSGGYRSEIVENTGLGGEYLAGVSYVFSEGGGVCDRCILIKTAKGNKIIARVVTYGATKGPGDIDVSPSVFTTLNEDEYPRTMTWQFAKCPMVGFIQYEFQTGANIWWSSLWVRNARVPIDKVEVKSNKRIKYFELQRGTDGTFTDGGGFGAGPFTLRVTAIDGQGCRRLICIFPHRTAREV